MQESGGYIKLYRKLKRWGWYKDTVVKCVFIHFLLSASYTDFEWMGQVFKPGQLITSISHLSEDLGFSAKQIRTAVDKLCSTKEIAKQTTNKYTVITVMNWESYQGDDSSNGRQTTRMPANAGQADYENSLPVNSKTIKNPADKTADEIRTNSFVNSAFTEITDIETASGRTNKGQTKGKQRANEGQQYNNIKNNKNIRSSSRAGATQQLPQLTEINSYISENGLNVNGRVFFEHYTDNGWKTESGRPVTDWKQLLRVWDSREFKKKTEQTSASYDLDLYERMLNEKD